MSCDTLQGQNVMLEVSGGDCGTFPGSVTTWVYWQGFITIKLCVHSASSGMAWQLWDQYEK
jgi:hypothetical protein